MCAPSEVPECPVRDVLRSKQTALTCMYLHTRNVFWFFEIGSEHVAGMRLFTYMDHTLTPVFAYAYQQLYLLMLIITWICLCSSTPAFLHAYQDLYVCVTVVWIHRCGRNSKKRSASCKCSNSKLHTCMYVFDTYIHIHSHICMCVYVCMYMYTCM